MGASLSLPGIALGILVLCWMLLLRLGGRLQALLVERHPGAYNIIQQPFSPRPARRQGMPLWRYEMLGDPVLDRQIRSVKRMRTVTFISGLAFFVVLALGTRSPARISPRTIDERGNALFPLSQADLQALLPGHYLRGCSEPTDSGPLILERDGRFEKVTGFGNYRGRYRIRDGEVAYAGVQDDKPVQWTDRFFRDAAGSLHIHRGLGGTPAEPDLRPIDSQAHALGCPME
jgi:hypothetical protein